MGELGDALALILTSESRYRTLRVVQHERCDPELMREAERRAWGDDGDAEELDDRYERDAEVRLWYAAGVGRRVETVRGGEPDVHVAPAGGDPHVVDRDAFLGLAGALGALRFEMIGRGRVAERDTIELRAIPRSGTHDLIHTGLDEGADAYELSIDAERGVLLAVTTFLGGREMSRTETVEVAFDEELDAELFAAPDDTDDEPWEPRGHPVTLAEAATLVPYPLFTPSGLDPGWRTEVVYGPADHDEPAFVAIRLEREDGLYSAGIVQSDAAERSADDAYIDWRDGEHGGEPIRIAGGDEPAQHEPIWIEVTRGATRIVLSSQTLPHARLLELLDLLAPI